MQPCPKQKLTQEVLLNKGDTLWSAYMQNSGLFIKQADWTCAVIIILLV